MRWNDSICILHTAAFVIQKLQDQNLTHFCRHVKMYVAVTGFPCQKGNASKVASARTQRHETKTLVNLRSKPSQFSHKETTEFSWKSILSHETPSFGALGMWCIKCSGEGTWFHPNSSNNPSKSCQAETDFDLILLMSADGSLARLGGWATHACLWVCVGSIPEVRSEKIPANVV